MKCFDEILVNAIDHWIRYPNLVKDISIDFKPDSTIIIKNSGPGIQTDKFTLKKKDGSEYEMYRIEMLCTKKQTGSNLDENIPRITGGTNGIGLKFGLYHSRNFKIETYHDGIIYTQEITNTEEKVNIGVPTLTKTNKAKSKSMEYTKISYLLDYSIFHRPELNDHNNEDFKEFHSLFEKIIMARAIQTSVYCSIPVYFNGVQLKYNFDDFMNLIKLPLMDNDEITLESYTCKLQENDYCKKLLSTNLHKFCKLDVGIIIKEKPTKQFGLDCVSIMNGLLVQGGNHFKYIKNQLESALKEKANKLIKTKTLNIKTILNNYIILVIKGATINPEWDAQRKSVIMSPMKNFEGYDLPNKIINNVWNKLKEITLQDILEKDSKVSKKSKIIQDINHDIAEYAKDPKKKRKSKFPVMLFVPEGESPKGNFDKIRSSGCIPSITNKNTGIFTLKGVPMNSRKEVTKVSDIQEIKTQKLIDNKVFNGLINSLGLQYGRKYTDTKSLNYDYLVILVDQDTDGKGKIASLIMSFIHHFWVDLYDLGFVKRLATPLIRIFSGKKLLKELYTENEYRKYIESSANENLRIIYYKGLGKHSEKQFQDILNKFQENLLTYTLENSEITKEITNKTFDVYFGKDTDLRKNELRTPALDDDIPFINTSYGKSITCYHHLKYDAKEHSLDDIARKVLHIVDGLNPVRRKIFTLCRRLWSSENSKRDTISVASLSGMLISDMAYHHGDASASVTITTMGQSFFGAECIPLILAGGCFGSRKHGGKDAASPRYITTKINDPLTSILFPRKDDVLLSYTLIEGERYEPDYYVPIIPYVLVQNMCIPLTGWKSNIYPRDYKQIITKIRNRLNGIEENNNTFDPWSYGFLGSFKKIWKIDKDKKLKKVEYSFGKYHYNSVNNKIYIRELPYLTWTESFKNFALTKEVVSDCVIKSHKDENFGVNIVIKLQPDGLQKIMEKEIPHPDIDAIEQYFGLVVSQRHNLNLFGLQRAIKEFDTYEEIFEYWYPVRYNLFNEQIERERILNEVEIIILQNVIRYIEEYRTKLNIIDVSKNEAYKRLEDAGYIKLTKEYDPYTPTDKLKDVIFKDESFIKTSIGVTKRIKPNYKYLININDSMKFKKQNEERKKQLKKLQEKQNDLQQNINHLIKQRWIKKLDKLERIIEDGIKKNWRYLDD